MFDDIYPDDESEAVGFDRESDEWFLKNVCGFTREGGCLLAGREECEVVCPRRVRLLVAPSPKRQ